MSVGGPVRVGRGAWTVRTFLPLHLFLLVPSLPRREKQEAPMEGAMGSSTGNLRWGSGTTGNLDAPFLRALSWGAITGRAAQQMRKEENSESQKRPNVRLQASSNFYHLLPPHLLPRVQHLRKLS